MKLNKFIFNELNNAETQLFKENDKIAANNAKKYIFMLAKYNFFVQRMDDNDNYASIIDYMSQNWVLFSEPDYHEVIKRSIKNAKKKDYKTIENVSITRSELQYISNLNNIRLEKVAFVLLCLAKYGHYGSDSKDYWVNYNVSQVFSLARVHLSTREQYELLHQLKMVGAIEASHKPGNASLKVFYVSHDKDDEVILKLGEDDFKELAYTYLYYKNGFSGYVKCECCGRLVRQKSNRQKYCKECAKIMITESKRLSAKRYRESISKVGN